MGHPVHTYIGSPSQRQCIYFRKKQHYRVHDNFTKFNVSQRMSLIFMIYRIIFQKVDFNAEFYYECAIDFNFIQNCFCDFSRDKIFAYYLGQTISLIFMMSGIIFQQVDFKVEFYYECATDLNFIQNCFCDFSHAKIVEGSSH